MAGQITFEDWTGARSVASLGTNTGATTLPFQGWQRFKEAFAPELVARAVSESQAPVRVCLDPFGGSGTTALACQFLGVNSITVEVNPYLADLSQAKLLAYEPEALLGDLDEVISASEDISVDADRHFSAAPKTFLEPGHAGRWIFDRANAEKIVALLASIEKLQSTAHRRFFRVILGGTLVDASNVVVNGKGRRYRGRWRDRRRKPHLVVDSFREAAQRAINEIRQFGPRKTLSSQVLRGDSRLVLHHVESADLAVFSPPYPNSFDYTDIYNLELWTLGYLQGGESNRALRSATLSSHVQIARSFAAAPEGSPILEETLQKLKVLRSKLWSPWIPEMVGAYFADLVVILDHLDRLLTRRGSAWIVIGDSRYVGVQVSTACILSELAGYRGWSVTTTEPFRSMRSSAQQGGRPELGETLLVMSPHHRASASLYSSEDA